MVKKLLNQRPPSGIRTPVTRTFRVCFDAKVTLKDGEDPTFPVLDEAEGGNECPIHSQIKRNRELALLRHLVDSKEQSLIAMRRLLLEELAFIDERLAMAPTEEPADLPAVIDQAPLDEVSKEAMKRDLATVGLGSFFSGVEVEIVKGSMSIL